MFSQGLSVDLSPALGSLKAACGAVETRSSIVSRLKSLRFPLHSRRLPSCMSSCISHPITRIHTSMNDMDASQWLQGRYAPFVSNFIEAILVEEKAPESHVRRLTSEIMDRLTGGVTIQKVGFLLCYSAQHKLSDLMTSRWRWKYIHSLTMETFGIEDPVSTETALVRLMSIFNSFHANADSWNCGRQ